MPAKDKQSYSLWTFLKHSCCSLTLDRDARGRIQTLNISIISHVFYHCANRAHPTEHTSLFSSELRILNSNVNKMPQWYRPNMTTSVRLGHFRYLVMYSQHFSFIITYKRAKKIECSLHWAGKACQYKRSSLLEQFASYGKKLKCCELSPWDHIHNTSVSL
jgi:hypothetical protein